MTLSSLTTDPLGHSADYSWRQVESCFRFSIKGRDCEARQKQETVLPSYPVTPIP